ncbi:hypothetical protein CLV62_13152 [Dysgonomonas alginatilytica]|uniref:Uncharacterized protein n=1 Tax=Dysgonomonas alginatilytica TaxID=1605892 RepID=A0A2V3PJ61_9BACT|nr:hypothetical protein [Dysgonomonas alginatilytica]PXV60132.1 hypothetical protein CLV62_13152 [Dysgonomonas alginatilytica]
MNTTQIRFNISYLMIGLFIGLLVGSISVFFICKSIIVPDIDVKYVKGETITDTAYIPIPYIVNVPGDIKYIPVYKKDSTGIETSEIDTAKSKDATVEDWNLERKYANTLFDNENGQLSYEIGVQNNKLSKFAYNFTPIQKVITTGKEQVWMPYASISYSTLNYMGIGGGIFYHDVGLGAGIVPSEFFLAMYTNGSS